MSDLDLCAPEDCGDTMACSWLSSWLAQAPKGWRVFGEAATVASVRAIAERAGYDPKTGLARQAYERGGAVEMQDPSGAAHALYWDAVE